MDKDAEAVLGMCALGYAFVEIGTVTPRPQPGQRRAAPVASHGGARPA